MIFANFLRIVSNNYYEYYSNYASNIKSYKKIHLLDTTTPYNCPEKKQYYLQDNYDTVIYNNYSLKSCNNCLCKRLQKSSTDDLPFAKMTGAS